MNIPVEIISYWLYYKIIAPMLISKKKKMFDELWNIDTYKKIDQWLRI